MATTDEMRFYEDIFTLLGEIPPERIVAKIEGDGRHAPPSGLNRLTGWRQG